MVTNRETLSPISSAMQIEHPDCMTEQLEDLFANLFWTKLNFSWNYNLEALFVWQQISQMIFINEIS